MKYIRTKDGIVMVNREILDGKAYEVKVPQSKWEYDEDNKCYYEDSKIDAFNKNEILAEADTIDELCDEFVLPKFREVFAIDRFSKQICINHIKCGNGDVYGAIWTDKGLIYVAKMNEKGDLVLI